MQILFLGPPGAGKGTQSKRLSSHLGIPHLSSGDLLREAVTEETSAGKEAKSYMDKGTLVPDAVLIEMFREKLHSPRCAKGFILDGFPRNVSQAQNLDKLLEELDCKLTSVINLQLDSKLIIERITGRRVCSNKTCKAQYHVKFSPPKVENICDTCGSPLEQRSDDKAELVEQRLRVYNDETAPLIKYYDHQLLVSPINGNGSPEEIFANILEALQVSA